MEKEKIGKGVLQLVLVFVAVLSCPGNEAKADEISNLKEQVSELQNRITQLEARQKLKERSFTEKIDEVAKQKTEQVALPDSLEWLENVKISGDLRYRHESIDEQSSGDWKSGVNRNRLRARLGLDAKVNDEWDLGFRIATGGGDPVSTNQDLDKSFSEKDIWFDRVFFTWHPAAMEGFDLVGGKMPNPFYTVGHNH